VCLFEMGTNRWRYFDSFPDREQKIYYLASDGLANMREDGGMLWEYEEESEPESLLPGDSNPFEERELTNTIDTLVHDPWRAVPALGGHAAFPGGSFDRSMLDCRSDILTYTSAPLARDLHIAGEVVVVVYCTADTPSFDLCAVLSEVHNNGRAYNFTQGYIRVDSELVPIRLPLQATCTRIAKGNCLRLSLSAACFPAYPVNPGNGKLPGETRLIEAQIITLTVKSGQNYPSQIQLSVVV
jgi:putative CocE/NonD family hydrolase